MRTEPEISTNRHQLQQQNTHNLNAIFDSEHETPSINFSPISIAEPTENGRFFHFGSFDIGPPLVKSDSVSTDQDDAPGIVDEARYNLATRVMSNGVEVIIAGDKNAKGTLKPNALRVLPGLSRKPMTLAPSTLKDQMILVMPSNAQENYTIPINSNHFITKTCLTTYTYRTTYLQDGKTTVESREKVVSNTATEERNYLKISPTESLGVTLSRTPELAVGVFYTTYTYYNTILDDDLPLVASSQHVLTNTITGPEDYISFLQPSEEATPVLETNTYLSRISLTKTLKESDVEKIVSTSNILTQVIITESLPPRSTAVMTSHMAFDLDETSAKSQPTESILTKIGLLPSSTSLTSFQTHAYFNAEKNEDNSSQVESNLNISQNSPQEMYFYMKKDGQKSPSKVSAIDKTSHLSPTTSLSGDINLKGAHQNDLHIYATKTYHTTFTYFTTLMNSQGNGASSTVVNFHTRVIENVITETIPNFIIDTNLLSKIETKLLNPKNHNSYVTKVTLAGGQPLEITAMNMLHPSLVATNTNSQNIAGIKDNISAKLEQTTSFLSSSVLSITPPPSVNSNEIVDSDVASSEIESLVADQDEHATTEFEVLYKNNTKTAGTTDFPSVNQLIGSINFNRLQALGPVFNAMAGLIQNNFATSQSNDLKKNLSLINVESKHSTKNISAYDNVPSHNGPIYIPVQNLKGESQHENVEDMKFAGYVSPQSLHIYPPETNWFLDENKIIKKPEISPGKPTYETPLLNGGIPISPGEVITANSDVIVGKPNGIQPRVPFKSKSPAENILVSPPSSTSRLPYKIQYSQSPKQPMTSPSPIPLEAGHEKQANNFDGILKPPPLKPPLQGLQQGMKKHNPHHAFSPNYRINYATSYMHQPQQIILQQIYQPIPITHPPQLGFQMQQQQQPQRPLMQRPMPNNLGFSTLNKSKPVPQKPNYIPYTPHDYDQSHSINEKQNEFEYNQQIHNNEILEIKQIPEVYSADLPATKLTSNRGNNSFGGGAYKTLIKKVINSDKPMLVDVQPSQITNIVIPRDNDASILVVESTVEMQKNGQYYDEPTTYPDTVVTGSIAHGAHARKPIISNQQVNLDTSVLSHNIDINVPPITFKKDAEFPHSTPVRGQINKNEPSNFYMPHVTIPITDNQIQVKLTPQSMLTKRIPGPILNDRNALNRSEPDDGIRPQNLGPIRHPSAYQKPIYYVTDMQMRPIYPNRPLKHPDAMEYDYQFGKINMPTPAPKVPQLVDLPKKTQPFLNVIPLNKTSRVPQPPYNPRPTVTIRPNAEDNLQIFTNASTNTQQVTTFNPVPLLNIFYGVQNDYEEDLSGDFSQGLQSNPGENYWVQNGHHQSDDDEDTDSTEGSNKIEDQKVSSSLNIEIPTRNQSTKHGAITISETNFTNILERQKNKAVAPMLSLKTQTAKRTTTTKIPSVASSANKLNFKPFLIGTESFLDPESVNAVNNMGELPPSSASPLKPNAVRNPPSYGKPFTQSKPITKPINHPKNEKVIVINSGEGFKLQHDKKFASTEGEEQVISINTKTVDDPQQDTKSQTETPFNPKYTVNTNKPSSMTSATTSSTPSSTKSSAYFNLNKMEVMASPEANTSQHNTHLNQSADIFDLHESINPHNHDFIHVALDEITTLQENIHKSGIMTQRPGSTNLYPVLSEPSVDMQPPPMSSLPQTESVMGLSPPPPPAVPSLSTFTPLLSPPDKSYHTINVTNDANHYPLMRPVGTTQSPFKLHSRPTKVTTSSRFAPSSSRPKIIEPSTTHSSTVSRRMPLLPVSKLTTPSAKTSDIPLNKSSTIKKENVSVPERAKDDQEISRPGNTTKTTTQGTGKNGGNIIPMFSLNQKIPNNILVDGSEEDAEQMQSTVKVLENQTTATTITLQPAIKTEKQSTLQSRPQTTLNHINTRTRIISRIIIPTKYVTNTQILTVTTTKTSVQTSLGIPSTQTLTLTKTKTFTLVDTVTETQTLLQPTRVIETHKATATYVIHASSPSEVIKSTIEVVSPEGTNEEPKIPNEPTAHTTKSPKVKSTTTSDLPQDLESNSIFVVMTDKKSRDGVFSISPSMIETPQSINAIGSSTGDAVNENSNKLDYDDNITFDLPARDEEAEANEVNHVLLGGVLIATPPKVSENSHLDTTLSSCRPSCKASRNEVCQQVEKRSLCVCRPGFARMFPDRPCRPTYTYAMQIPIHRVSKQVIHFKEQYRIRDSEDFKQLAGITHDAVDRMVMQSDLRDVYHGVHVTSFDATNTDNGILGKFLIQLSDNSDEKRLVDVFRKYLRLNNFSLGGTDIFTTKAGVDTLEIVDFNECAHSQFHDCSENSKCFNLQGTYTCSCQEGYADLSENSIYPGRICSAEMIGCEKCHYHGKCVQTGENIQPVCECFHWYTGASCKLNLKILLIALIAIGTILFMLLLFCVLVTCTRRRKNRNMQSLMSGIHIIAPRNSRLSSKCLTADKRAMIKDTSSEASQNSLPYALKKDLCKQSALSKKSKPNQHAPIVQQVPNRNINQRGHPSSTLVSSMSEMDHRHSFTEQNDRSLTVMIPRAKYHNSTTQPASHTETVNSATYNNEADLKSSPTEKFSKASMFYCNPEKIQIASSKAISAANVNHGALHTTSAGALVSAGFEVSATVGSVVSQHIKSLNPSSALTHSYESRGNQIPKLIDELHSRKSNHQDLHTHYNTYKEGEKFIDSMDVWLDTIQQNELANEARSFDETTIQAPTKSLRSVYERQMSQSNGNDEANTMAERDVGSTFLLPHTHLYKPDRDSDVSGFDSF